MQKSAPDAGILDAERRRLLERAQRAQQVLKRYTDRIPPSVLAGSVQFAGLYLRRAEKAAKLAAQKLTVTTPGDNKTAIDTAQLFVSDYGPAA